MHDATDLATEYNNRLRTLLDQLAPPVKKKVTLCHKVPWFDSDALIIKRQLRHVEKVWRFNNTAENWSDFSRIRISYKHLNACKAQYVNQQIEDCGNYTRRQFDTITRLTGQCQDNPLPEG